MTIIEACQQLIERTDARVLLTAPSNTAADVLCSRLGFSEEIILRLNAPSRMLKDVPPAVMNVSYVEDDSFACPQLDRLQRFRVIVATCVSASILRGVGIEPGHFSHIFVDEVRFLQICIIHEFNSLTCQETFRRAGWSSNGTCEQVVLSELGNVHSLIMSA